MSLYFYAFNFWPMICLTSTAHQASGGHIAKQFYESFRFLFYCKIFNALEICAGTLYISVRDCASSLEGRAE